MKKNKGEHDKYGFPKDHISECLVRPTTRNVIKKNWRRCKERYLILSNYLKKKDLSWKTDFWWAKVQRKIVLLRMLCKEFEKQTACSCKSCKHKEPIRERITFILKKVKDVEDSLEPFKKFFTHVPTATYGYAISSPFMAEKDRRNKIEKLIQLHVEKN